MKIKRFRCPVCGSNARINGSREQSKLMRTAYAQCESALCGASFRLDIAVTHAVSPPSDLFEPQAERLRLPSMSELDTMTDMASDFVAELIGSGSASSRDDAVSACVLMLHDRFPVVAQHELQIIAVRAVAEQESRSCWQHSIATDLTTSAAVIICRLPSDAELSKGVRKELHAISLRELAELIEARRATDDGRLL